MTTEREPHTRRHRYADGVFSIIAMDQRNTLRRMFSAVGIDATDDDLITSKTDVARALTPLASGILFDPTYGVPAVTGTGALAETCGLLVASEPAERGKLGRGADHAPRPRPGRAVGADRRAATPISSSPSCGPTVRHRRAASRTSSPSACRRCVRSSRTAGSSASLR